MKNLAASLLLITSLLFSSVVMSKKSIHLGQVGRVEGEAYIISENNQRVPIDLRMRVFLHDTVSTGKNGRVAIQLNDGTFIYLGGDTVFEFEKIKWQKKKKEIVLNYVTGMMALKPEKHLKKKPADYFISTPLANISVKHTGIWLGQFSKDILDIASLTDGYIFVTNKHGKVLLDKKGYGTTIVADDEAPSKNIKWSRDKVNAARQSVGF